TEKSSGDNRPRTILDGIGLDIYRRNAFRVLGFSVTTTARDLAKRQSKLKIMEALGRSVAAECGAVMPLVPPPSEAAISKARQRLDDPETRIFDEFFWFWPMDWGRPDADEGLRLLHIEGVD